MLIVRDNPGISYSYWMKGFDNRVPSLRTAIPIPTPKVYTWTTDVTACTKSCAGGKK